MLRSAASKVVWVGRATVFLVGLAVILAMVVGLASTALAANGANLIIGNGISDTAKNIATLPTRLTMQGTGSGPALQLTQQSTNTGAQGLGVTVPSGKVPIAVNSTAGKATNLNADKLDGKDSGAFVPASRVPMWVVVNFDGTIARKSPEVVSVLKQGTGDYVVQFNRDVSQCAFAATMYHSQLGQIYAGNFGSNSQVTTWDRSGTNLVDKTFHLIVTC